MKEASDEKSAVATDLFRIPPAADPRAIARKCIAMHRESQCFAHAKLSSLTKAFDEI